MRPKFKRFLLMTPVYGLGFFLGVAAVELIHSPFPHTWWYLLIAAVTAGVYLSALDFVCDVRKLPMWHTMYFAMLAIPASLFWWLTIPLTLLGLLFVWLICYISE